MRTLSIITALLYCALVVSLGFPGEAKGEVITFNDEASLAALSYPGSKAADGTFCGGLTPPDIYVEQHMVFHNGFSPEDPRSSLGLAAHYHLMYEDPAALALVISGKLKPEKQPRYLANMPTSLFGGSVIQMTYEPNRPGQREPFNLISIHVLTGKLNVGIEFRDGSIGIYNNLTPGQWGFIGGNNLIRATLEYSFEEVDGGVAAVDDIGFTPATSSVGAPFTTLPSHASVDKRANASLPFLDPTTLDFFVAGFAPLPRIDISPGDPTNVIDLKSETVSVAILTTKGFDATRVDPRSVNFGRNGVKAIDHAIKGKNFILRFSTGTVGFRCEDNGKEFLLFGKTFGGSEFVGSDFVRVDGCDFNANR